MPAPLPRRRTVEHLRKEAKRWLADLRDNLPEAKRRLAEARDPVPDSPTLRDVQLALARQNGFDGWTALRQALDPDPAVAADVINSYEERAQALLEAYPCITIDRTHLAPTLSKPAHAWISRAGMDAEIARALGELPECRRRRRGVAACISRAA